MSKVLNNTSYYNLVEDILNDNEFKKIDNCTHHGISRYDHSCRVSYFSYRLTKALHLSYVETARAGLLHDFFLTENTTKKEKFVSMFKHSKLALENSCNLFYLTDKEKNIIYSHMFPLNLTRIPKYLESWIVSIVDKFVAVYEFSYSFKIKVSLKYQHAMVIILLILGRTS